MAGNPSEDVVIESLRQGFQQRQKHNGEPHGTCPCSCHPRPADPSVHGGEKCVCQLTDAERRARTRAFLAETSEWGQSLRAHEKEQEALAQEAARSVGATIRSYGGLAPFVIRGTVDGRAFYLRERHDTYTVVIAPDDAPGDDPWSSSTPDGITVATGTVEDLLTDGHLDATRATTLAVSTVRVFLRRRDCTHETASEGAWFCPACGTPVHPLTAI